MASASGMPLLFKHYPLLGDKLPYVSLGEFPTPIEKLNRLGTNMGINHLYIKLDGLSGKVYGGNKIRKLEFILGNALRTKAKEVLTFGAAGSNFALATAIYAQQVGLKSISMLMPQPNAHYVRRNLLMSHYSQAELHLPHSRLFVTLETKYQLLRHKAKYGHFPQIIPFGGSSPLGTTGFVNAALELVEQIRNGEIPEPDRIYVPLGTMGTTVGLILGLKVADLKSRVIGVRVLDETTANERNLGKLFGKTSTLYLEIVFAGNRNEGSNPSLSLSLSLFLRQ